jgi:hypothetical protein
MEWQALSIEEGNVETTPCDCCGSKSIRVDGDVADGDAYLGWYSAEWSDGHQDVPLRLYLYTGNWSEGAAQETRFGMMIEYRSGEDGGYCLLDWPPERRAASKMFTMLDRADVIGSDYAASVRAMTDAILMKDTRIVEWNK